MAPRLQSALGFKEVVTHPESPPQSVIIILEYKKRGQKMGLGEEGGLASSGSVYWSDPISFELPFTSCNACYVMEQPVIIGYIKPHQKCNSKKDNWLMANISGYTYIYFLWEMLTTEERRKLVDQVGWRYVLNCT